MLACLGGVLALAFGVMKGYTQEKCFFLSPLIPLRHPWMMKPLMLFYLIAYMLIISTALPNML